MIRGKTKEILRKIKYLFFNPYSKYVGLLAHIGSFAGMYTEEDQRSDLYVITIAYNHERLIEKQIELVKRYVKDGSFRHVIVDNSSQRKVRKQIREICEREKVEYVPVPHLIDKMICHTLFGNGLSHGAALNWLFFHYLQQRKPVRFALIDHDVFPMRDVSFIEKLGESDFYGVERIKDTGWYLWPGWCVFKYDAIVDKHPNFLPVIVDDVFFDAGGGNYLTFFNHYDLQNIKYPHVETIRIKRTEGLTAYNDIYHGDCIQYIDHAWLHLINGSNCAKIPGKEKFVNKMIDRIDELRNLVVCFFLLLI